VFEASRAPHSIRQALARPAHVTKSLYRSHCSGLSSDRFAATKRIGSVFRSSHKRRPAFGIGHSGGTSSKGPIFLARRRRGGELASYISHVVHEGGEGLIEVFVSRLPCNIANCNMFWCKVHSVTRVPGSRTGQSELRIGTRRSVSPRIFIAYELVA